MKERAQSRAEEVANSVTHGMALFAALVAVTFLVIRAADLGGVNVVGTSVFAVAMVLLYVTSTLYHALPHGRSKQLVLKLDHSAIYVFIASSYTPFALGALDSPWAWTIFGLVWSLAVLGGTLTVFDRLSHPGLSTALYLIMGWLVPVSYTHLDVYKRQIFKAPLARAAVLPPVSRPAGWLPEKLFGKTAIGVACLLLATPHPGGLLRPGYISSPFGVQFSCSCNAWCQ